MEQKKLTRGDIITTDIVYVIFTIFMAACFIAIAFVSVLIAVCGGIYLVKSFMLVHKFQAFVFTILMLLSDALFIYIDYIIFKSVKNSIQKYLKERKEIIEELDNKNS